MSLYYRGIDSMGPYEDISAAYDLFLPAIFAAFEVKYASLSKQRSSRVIEFPLDI